VRFVVTRRARRDIQAIQAFYDQSRYAQNWFEGQLREAAQHLLSAPLTALYKPELTSLDVRFWLMKPYWLVIRQDGDSLLLLAIVHTSRNLQKVLRDKGLVQ